MIRETVDKIVDFRPKDVPLGKSLLLLFLGAIPGKMTTKVVRLIIGKLTKGREVGGMDVYQLSNIVGPIVGFLEAMGWRSGFIKRNLGETFSEALAVGTVMGSVDAAFERGTVDKIDKDLSDYIADAPRDLVAKILAKVSGGTTETEGAGISGFPEAASSAWTGEQEYAGPSTEALGSPEEDPVESIENALEKMSKL